jgi:hypothetical protein
MCAFAAFGAPTLSQAADETIVLNPDLPVSVAIPQINPDLAELQHDFDVFSWQTFVALNWPAKVDGTPDKSLRIGQQGAPANGLWETGQSGGTGGQSGKPGISFADPYRPSRPGPAPDQLPA